jgi:hypothetical protein
VNAAYQTDGEQLAFEFRIMDTIGLGYVYSGATQTEGIIDDYLVMIDTIAPTIITDLQTLAVTTTTATLSWSPVTENHFAGYVVYYEASPGITNQNQVWTQAEDAALGNINTSQTTITGLMSGQRYWFRILARDAAGNAAELSNEVTNIANSTYPLFSSPVPAQNGQYHNTRTLTIGATVYDAYGIDQTHVEYRFDRNGNGSYDASETWQQVPSIQISRQEETLLLSAPAAFDVDGEHLCYEFRTWDIDGYGPAYSGTNAAMGISDDWFVSIDTSYPAAIPTLVIGVTTESSVQLAWAASSDNHFRRYEVYYATHPAVTAADSLWTDTDDASLSNSGSGLIATDVTNLPASTRFYFRVRAVDIAGNATWSDEVSAVTVGLYAPAAPTGIWVEVSGEDVILHWDAVSTDTNGNPLPVTGYNVYAAVMPDFTADLGSFIDFTAETSYTFSGIALEASLTNVFFKVTTVYQP